MRSAAVASTTRLFLSQSSCWRQNPPRKSKPGSFQMFTRLVRPRSCLILCFVVVHFIIVSCVRVFPVHPDDRSGQRHHRNRFGTSRGDRQRNCAGRKTGKIQGFIRRGHLIRVYLNAVARVTLCYAVFKYQSNPCPWLLLLCSGSCSCSCRSTVLPATTFSYLFIRPVKRVHSLVNSFTGHHRLSSLQLSCSNGRRQCQ